MPAFDKESAKLVHFYHLAEHASPPQAEPLLVSFIPPNAYWTPAEKTAFFQSLSRHSRWRPDLISDELGSGKSVADVCSYIDLLEQGLREAQNTSRSRDTLPIAYEVSEDWVHAEESMAKMLRAEEWEWQRYALKRKRTDTVRAAKQITRPVDGQENNDAAVGSIFHSQGLDEEGKTWQERLAKRKQDFAEVWKREDLLSSLDGKYLKAMEAMVRALEQHETEKELEDSKDTSKHRIPVSSTVPVSSQLSQSPSSHLKTNAHPEVVNVDNSQIDPALIALDMQSLSRPGTNGTPMIPVAEAIPPPQATQTHLAPSITGVHSQPPHVSSTPGPGALSNIASSPAPLELPADLSPASRRRIRKRLWMRRKRALLNGLPESEVSTDTRKLKPGRKGKQQDERENSETPQNEEKGAETDGSESDRKKKPPGWSKLQSVDVDGLFIREAGLDLFSLGNFAGLTSLLSDVYQPADQVQDGVERITTSLSYPLLLLLRAHLACFVTHLIGQIITQKQVETQQKKRIRSGFHSSRALKIRPKNVHEALRIVGCTSNNKRFFRRLQNHVRDTTGAGDGREKRRKPQGHVESDDSVLSDTSGTGSDSDRDFDTDVSDHQDDLNSARRLALRRNFVPQSQFQLVWDFNGDEGDVTLLPEELDEEALLKELKAEEAVDRRDQRADRELEDSLWEEIGVQRDVSSDHIDVAAEPEPSEGKTSSTVPRQKKGAKSIRFRKPGGAIKSRVYITDSDDEEGPD